MPTSGLVITANQVADVALVLTAIASDPHVEPGQPAGNRIPLVLDTPDKATDKRLWDWLGALPGVAHVDVAFIYLGESHEEGSPNASDESNNPQSRRMIATRLADIQESMT